MRYGRLSIKAARWPWQPQSKSHPIHIWGRFGGGWHYKLGIMIGGNTVIIDLLFGSIRFVWEKAT